MSYFVESAVMEDTIDDRSNESPVSAFDIELQVGRTSLNFRSLVM